MQGAHPFSTNRKRRRRIIYFGIGGIGALMTIYLGPALATITGYGELAGVSLSFTFSAMIGYLIISRGLWKVDSLSGILASPPDLRGRWKGHLYTSSDEYNEEEVLAVNELGHDLAKMDISMHIDQTWDTIGIAFNGPNSESDSTGATFVLGSRNGDSTTLTYNYENDGSTLGDLEHHIGTTVLEYNPDDDTLEGTYYTGPNRGNYGLIRVERVENST